VFEFPALTSFNASLPIPTLLLPVVMVFPALAPIKVFASPAFPGLAPKPAR